MLVGSRKELAIDSSHKRGLSTYRRDEGLSVGRLSVEGYYVGQNIDSSHERFLAVSRTRSIPATRDFWP